MYTKRMSIANKYSRGIGIQINDPTKNMINTLKVTPWAIEYLRKEKALYLISPRDYRGRLIPITHPDAASVRSVTITGGNRTLWRNEECVLLNNEIIQACSAEIDAGLEECKIDLAARQIILEEQQAEAQRLAEEKRLADLAAFNAAVAARVAELKKMH